MRRIDADALIEVIKKSMAENPHKEKTQRAMHIHEHKYFLTLLTGFPTIQPEERTEKRMETHACDLISRQAAIDAVDAIGHIATMPDGDKCIRRSAVKYTLSMLPSAQTVATDTNVGNNSEIPNSSDCISRQAAIDAADKIIKRDTSGSNAVVNAMIAWSEYIRALPTIQPEPSACECCHEDSDGYVTPIEKNGHASIRFGMDGWELSLHAKGWHGSAKIKYCPICGRRLTHE